MQQHQNGLTLKELAKFIGVTTQTVRNKLKKIRAYFFQLII